MKELVLFLTILASGTAHAATFQVTFNEPAVVNGTQLKPGSYTLDLEGDTVVIAMGNSSIQAPVKTDNTAPENFAKTVILYGYEKGKFVVKEIEMEGTRTTLVFVGGATVGGGD